MEVSRRHGLARVAREASGESGKDIPFEKAKIGMNGDTRDG
jgi:hypothetical protein